MGHNIRFCTDCPDHEACATGAPCHTVKDIVPPARWAKEAPLLLAAEHMRDNHREGHPRHEFWSQLATSLEFAATQRGWENAALRFQALAVANAYLEAVQ